MIFFITEIFKVSKNQQLANIFPIKFVKGMDEESCKETSE